MSQTHARSVLAGMAVHAAAGAGSVVVAVGSAVEVLDMELELRDRLPAPVSVTALRRIAIHGETVYVLAHDRVLVHRDAWEAFDAAGTGVRDIVVWRDVLVVLDDGGVSTIDLATTAGARRTALAGRYESLHDAGDAVAVLGRGSLTLIGGSSARATLYRTGEFPTPTAAWLARGDLVIADHLTGVVHVTDILSTCAGTTVDTAIVAPYAISGWGDGWIVLGDDGAFGRRGDGPVRRLDVPRSSSVLTTVGGDTLLIGPKHVIRLDQRTEHRRAYPGFVHDVERTAGATLCATDDGLHVVRGDVVHVVKLPGGARAIRADADRAWVAGPSGVWCFSIDGDPIDELCSDDSGEPVSLGFDRDGERLLWSTGWDVRVLDLLARGRLARHDELRMYPHRIDCSGGVAWAACGDGGALVGPASRPAEWRHVGDVAFATDVAATSGRAVVATTNGVSICDTDPDATSTLVRRPDAVAVACGPENEIVTAHGSTIVAFTATRRPVGPPIELPFPPRRLRIREARVLAAGLGGALEVDLR